MEIKRDLYLNQLIERKQNGLIKMITGIRRCGKSYLLNTLFYDYLKNSGVDENHIIKFAFDSSVDLKSIGENIVTLEKEKRKVNPDKFMTYIQSKMTDKETYYLLLDEVQLLDCFESVLNGYLHMDNVDVYVTGGNAKFLSKDIITEFAGRGDEIHMQPLSFAEFMSAYKGDKYEGLKEYMLYGGIPMVVLRDGAENKSLMLKRLFDEIYIRDTVESEPILEKEEFKNFDSETYRKQIFSMFGGELEEVTVQFDKELLNDIYDKFGTDIEIQRKYGGALETTLSVQVSKTFFLWVVGTLVSRQAHATAANCFLLCF